MIAPANSLKTVNAIDTPADVGAGAFTKILAESTVPVLLQGLVADWPVVKSAQESYETLDTYLRRLYRGSTVGVFAGAADIGGRFFYNENLSGLNFERSRQKLDTVLDQLKAQRENPASPSFYVGATTVDNCLPEFRVENALDFGDIGPLASIWIGNRTRIAAHYDLPDNLACVAAGRRRFTLFPPDQMENLYVGPIDFTPAGQQISLVDFHRPDFERFPRFRQALERALVVDMSPGDAIFIPSMWWHHVESLDSLNVLVNYWWRKSPAYMGPPVDVLYHALLSIRDLPPEQKKAWADIFQHYIFSESTSLAHMPESSLGSLGQIDETMARKLRATLLNKLNR
jgi:hypothetical protein